MTVNSISLFRHSVNDQECFHQDLNKINEWCVTNKMRFNARKCKVVKITKKKSPFSYDFHIDGAKLDSVSFHRDLGLVILFLGTLPILQLRQIGVSGSDINNVTTLKTLY